MKLNVMFQIETFKLVTASIFHNHLSIYLDFNNWFERVVLETCVSLSAECFFAINIARVGRPGVEPPEWLPLLDKMAAQMRIPLNPCPSQQYMVTRGSR